MDPTLKTNKGIATLQTPHFKYSYFLSPEFMNRLRGSIKGHAIKPGQLLEPGSLP